MSEELAYTRMGSGGRCSFRQLREAVAEATTGSRDHAEIPEGHPGHKLVGVINYNSLDRIITAFVDAALSASTPPPSQHREPIEADRKLADEIYNALRDEGWFPASRVAQMITAHRLAISRSATADSIAATIIAPGTTAEQLRNFIAAAVRDDRVTPALPLPKAREGDHG